MTMYTFFFFFIFFFSLLPHQLFCKSVFGHGRRVLHQPFFPLDSLPPSQPPISSSPPPPPPPPPDPKYPFSSTPPSSINPSPFFPTYPSPPPPPSSPTFASFPANISSLILPHSPQRNSSSQKLLPLAIASVISALVVVALLVFFYWRRRRNRNSADDKAFRSDNGSSVISAGNPQPTNGIPKLRNTSATSSEFLYLGTLVSSRGIDDRADSRNNDRGGGGRDSSTRKLDSPELHPLPPLGIPRQSGTQTRRNGDLGSNGDDEVEEFYSPRGSLSGTGSGSRRVSAAMASEGFMGKSSESSTTSSYSTSSGSASPARSRSKSLSLSPPVSLSPTKSPRSATLTAAVEPTLPPPQTPPFQTHFETASPACLSPGDTVWENIPRSSSSGSSNVFVQNMMFSISSNPDGTSDNEDVDDEGEYEIARRMSNVSDPNKPSPSSPNLSPLSARALRTNPVLSPRMTNFLDSYSDPDINQPSPPLSSLSSSPSPPSSPDRVFNTPPRLSDPSDTKDELSEASPANSNVSDQIEKSPASINAFSNPLSAPPICPPPPPPPPPRIPPAKQWETSNSSSTPLSQPVNTSPTLLPPSRPFTLENSSKLVSPIGMSPSFNTIEKFEDSPKPKLKPLHWDKVRASSDREMVWDQLRSSSFKLNEEMIETLFVVNTSNLKPKDITPRSVLPTPNQENRVLDPKKSQNIAISLRALNVTIDEVCEALVEGNADALGTELLESLIRMAPTKEEERKLKEYKDDSPFKLGPAEKFLKAVLDVPFAFKRVDAMLYIANFESEVEYLKKSFDTLEAACEELRSSRMFLKLLEAVLKTGNRMNVGTNRGDAHAFKLDTLLKLVDIKGADGKTTLLHFVVQEIIRTEGARLSNTNQIPNSTTTDDAKCRKLGLQVVSSLSSELINVKKAAAMDSDVLGGEVSKLSRGIENIGEVLQLNESIGLYESKKKFSESMNSFMKMAEEEIFRIQAHESVALSLVKEITEYFHGNSTKEEAHPFRIFMVVRDFLATLDGVCKEVGMINERTIISSAHKFPVPVNPTLPQFPGFRAKLQNCSSEEGDSE